MNYVTNMLARPKTIRTSQMASVSDVNKGMEIYLKNSFVCLKSVKLYNPEVNCMLVVDFDLEFSWKERFEANQIEIVKVPFGGFQISDEFNWGIVQYRYDVMQYLCGILKDDDKVIMLDTDVVCVGSLDDVFDEIEYRVCLYDVQHAKNLKDRKYILDNYLKIYPEKKHCELIHYGGEFIGSNGLYLRAIFEASKEVMAASKFVKDLENFNDEHITSIAIYNNWNCIPVNNANAYLYRYWTNPGMYLTSTNYKYNPVVLWHLPFEKNRGLLYVYKVLINKNELPSTKQLAELFGFPYAKRHYVFKGLQYKIGRKLGFY